MAVGADSVGMATVVRRLPQLCIKMPDRLSDEEEATMPHVYVIVLMFLVEEWKLSKGQSLLTHSAAGGGFSLPNRLSELTPLGIGICTIRVARWLGAEIFATAGGEDKATFLVEELGIPRNLIFVSRNSSFL